MHLLSFITHLLQEDLNNQQLLCLDLPFLASHQEPNTILILCLSRMVLIVIDLL